MEVGVRVFLVCVCVFLVCESLCKCNFPFLDMEPFHFGKEATSTCRETKERRKKKERNGEQSDEDA